MGCIQLIKINIINISNKKMNILSSEEMKEKEEKLLKLYEQNEIKFKFSLEELLEAKQKGHGLFCFKKVQTKTQIWIQKLVPLHKRVQKINLEQEENGIFKVLSFIFLLIIYKPKQEWNHYILQHLKCSLYSDDIDLLEIRNHSFNKKMKNDTIKAVIATFFVEIQNLLQKQLQNPSKINVQDVLAFALQKNDIIVEGFHLFYRTLLSKFDLEGAKNCIEEINPQQAIQSLIDYFEIDCGIFNDLYLFSEAGIFLARIQQKMMFGRYYENELYFQQSSAQQLQDELELKLQKEVDPQGKVISEHDEIQRNDVKIFNFLLDTDRNTEQNFQEDRSQQGATPCFQNNQQMKFGKKTDRELDASFSKLKNRIHDEKIHQISSEEQEIDAKKQNILAIKGFSQKDNFQVQNKFLNLGQDDDEDYTDSDAAPTPMLGGGQIFAFGTKLTNGSENQNTQPKNLQFASPSKQIPTNTHSNRPKNNDRLLQTKEIRTSAIRRQTYQGQNSSQSKSSDNLKKIQMKTSKNQIKVMDGTASQVNLGKLNESLQKPNFQQFLNGRKQTTMMECEKTSSYSNCTCHLQKRAKIKLNSQILNVSVGVNNKPKFIYEKSLIQDPSRKVSTQIFEPSIKKQLTLENVNNDSRKLLFKNNSNKSTQNLKNQQKKSKSPAKQLPKDQIKSPQFINFLKKDKSELIKKLTQKRIAKNNITSGEMNSHKNLDQAHHNAQPNKRFVKQSMFVGSYNFHNPQKIMNTKHGKNRSITPSSSIDKHQRNRNQRSRTPTQPNDKVDSSEGMKLFKVNNNESKPVTENFGNTTNLKSAGVGFQNNSGNFIGVNANLQKGQIPMKVPPNTMHKIPVSQQHATNGGNIKCYDFFIKQ